MIRILGLILLLTPFMAPGQDVNLLLDQAARFENAFRENEALQKYAEALRLQPNNEKALCKCSELSCRIGARQDDKSKQLEYFNNAKMYATNALQLNPNSSESNLVMSFAMARIAMVSGGKEKMAAVTDVKKYAERAVQLDPQNYKAWHVLGRWQYEVSNLNGFERMIARWFYGSLPAASLKTAILYFEKSRSLMPAFILNYLELARSYRKTGERSKAIYFLKLMLPMPNQIADDARAKAEGKKMLQDLE